MSQRWFANRGQMIQTVCTVISALAALGVVKAFSDLPPWASSLLWALFYVAVGMSLILAWQWLGPKGISSKPILPSQPEYLAVQDILLERSDEYPHVEYKRKLRIILSNTSGKHMIVGPGTKWVTGRDDVKARPLEQQVLELDGPGGWHADSWAGQEKAEISVAPGRAIRTWIGLHSSADEVEVRRRTATRSLGTLIVPIKADGICVEQQFRL